MTVAHQSSVCVDFSLVWLLVAMTGAAATGANPADGGPWVRVTETDTRIEIETDKLAAAIRATPL